MCVVIRKQEGGSLVQTIGDRKQDKQRPSLENRHCCHYKEYYSAILYDATVFKMQTH